MSKKFEQLLEYVVNNETEKANALFHDIVVAKSREIYENLIASEAEAYGGDDVEDLLGEISDEEEGMPTFEADDESEIEELDDEGDMGPPALDDEDMGMDAASDEEGDMDAMPVDDEAGMEDMEDRLVDLEDALKQLQADFDAKLSDEGDSDEMPADDMGDEEEVEADEEEGEEDMGEEEEEEEEDEDEKAVMEFVEKATKPVTTEPSGLNTTSPLAKGAKSPTGAGKPVQVKDGAEGKHGHGSASAPKPGKMTTAGNKVSKLTKVSTPSNKG